MSFKHPAIVSIALSVVFFISSCVTVKKISYATENSTEKYLKNTEPYKLKEGDNVYIEVRSLDPSTTAIFNLKMDGRSDPYNDASIYLNSYFVNDSGYIDFPISGFIKVKGLDIRSATKVVQDTINNYFNKSYVSLKLINAEITILGEVNKAGTYKMYQTEIDILKALGMAGDITVLGNKHHIKIIRNDGKESSIAYVDLTQAKAMESATFYLQPGDVVIVPSVWLRPLDANLAPWRTILLTLSGAFVAIRLLAGL